MDLFSRDRILNSLGRLWKAALGAGRARAAARGGVAVKLVGFCLVFAFAAGVIPVGQAVAQSLATQSLATGSQFLLLENGGVLRGEVRLIGGVYVLATDGGEIRVASNQVRLVESSLNRIVQRLRAEQAAPTVEDRLRLAAWCERQQLWAYAAQELIAAQRESPGDGRVVAAQRRLWHTRELVLSTPERDSPRRDDFVRPASFTQSAQAPTTDLAPAGSGSSPALSAEAVQDFTRHIQPILVNNCTIAGCHAAGGERSFQLNRDLLHGLANHRSTRMNLEAAVGAISAVDPEQSPLLLAMQPSHAGGKVLGRGYRWKDYQKKLADWVNLVAGRGEESSGEPLPDAPPQPEPPHPSEGGAASASVPTDVYAPGYYESLLNEADFSAAGEPSAAKPPRQPVTRGVQLKRVRERDAFDPEIFNSRYHGPSAGPDGVAADH